MSHVTHDMWHEACDMWHMTCDTWHVTHGGGWTFSQNVSSLPLLVWVEKWFKDLEEKDDLVDQLSIQLINEWQTCL